MALVRELNGAFSGSDFLVTLLFPEAQPIILGHATTVTYSTYREVGDVRALGRVGIKGVARGTRTVAGTIILTMINQHWVNDVRQAVPYLSELPLIRPDELPLFDLAVTAANEYGQTAAMVIYGATFVDEGATLSVENLFSEMQQTYKAHDIRLFEAGAWRAQGASSRFMEAQPLPIYQQPAVRSVYTSSAVMSSLGITTTIQSSSGTSTASAAAGSTGSAYPNPRFRYLEQ